MRSKTADDRQTILSHSGNQTSNKNINCYLQFFILCYFLFHVSDWSATGLMNGFIKYNSHVKTNDTSTAENIGNGQAQSDDVAAYLTDSMSADMR